MADFLSAEEAEVAGPSDFIMTRGNRDDDDEEEAAPDSDTDDVDHTGEKNGHTCAFSSFGTSLKMSIRLTFQRRRRAKRRTPLGTS